jgi:hypothetical protein
MAAVSTVTKWATESQTAQTVVRPLARPNLLNQRVDLAMPAVLMECHFLVGRENERICK